MIFSTLADIGLSTGHWPVLCLVFVIGLYLTNKTVMLRGLNLVLFSILVNVTLKGLFKVPLSPTLHKIGYAFPSGHMQMVTICYGWLALYLRAWYWRTLIVLILLGEAFGLMYYQYHTLVDILGALVVGVLLIAMFVSPIKPLSTLLLSTVCMVMIYIEYHAMPLYAGAAYGFLLLLLIITKKTSISNKPLH